MDATVRQKKTERLLQKELSEILRSDKRALLQKEWVSITAVCISPDLGTAKVYISMALAKDKQTLLERINASKGEVRKALGIRIGKQVRRVPQLLFLVDKVEEDAQRIGAILDKLDIPPHDEKADP